MASPPSNRKQAEDVRSLHPIQMLYYADFLANCKLIRATFSRSRMHTGEIVRKVRC